MAGIHYILYEILYFSFAFLPVLDSFGGFWLLLFFSFAPHFSSALHVKTFFFVFFYLTDNVASGVHFYTNNKNLNYVFCKETKDIGKRPCNFISYFLRNHSLCRLGSNSGHHSRRLVAVVALVGTRDGRWHGVSCSLRRFGGHGGEQHRHLRANLPDRWQPSDCGWPSPHSQTPAAR